MEKENQLQIFNFKNSAIRTIEKEGELWWVAKDICTILSINNAREATRHLKEDEKGVISIDTLGGRQDITVVNEPGLYILMMRSRKPEAEAFTRWVTHEVLPAIRRTGSYSLRQNNVIAAMAAQLEQVTQTLAQLQAQLGAVAKTKTEVENRDGTLVKPFYRPISSSFSPEALFYIAERLKDDDVKKAEIYKDLLKICKTAGWEIGSRPSFYRITISIEGAPRCKHKKQQAPIITPE